MTEEKVTFVIDETGSDRAAQGFDRVDRALVDLDKASRRSNASFGALTKTVSAGASQAASKVSGLAGATAGLGTAVSAANPELGRMLGIIGTGGSAVSGIAGFGGIAAGAAAGGLIVAVGALAAAYKFAKDETDNLATATLNLNDTYDYNLALLKKLNSERSRRETVLLGGGSITDQLAEVRRLEAAETNIRTKLSDQPGGREGVRLKLERDRIRRELQRARENLRAVQAEQARFAIEGDANVDANLRTIGGGGAGPAENFGTARSGAQLARLDELQRRTAGDISTLEKMRKVTIELKREETENFLAEERRKTDAFREAENERRAVYEKQSAAMEAVSRERQQAEVGALQIVGQAGVQAFADIAKGQKVSARAVLAGIGDTMVGEGSRYFFSGLGRVLLGDPTGAALMKVGGLEIAGGIALGATTAPSGGAGGGGGGGSRAEPTRVRRGSDGGTSVTNVYLSSTVAPSYEDGRRVKQALREVEIRDGRAA